MRNPHQLADYIDARIAERRAARKRLDIASVSAEILAALPADDRRGIDPALFEDVVVSRIRRHPPAH